MGNKFKRTEISVKWSEKKIVERVDGTGMCHKFDAQTNRMRYSIRIYP